jgi:hypothetical protein
MRMRNFAVLLLLMFTLTMSAQTKRNLQPSDVYRTQTTVLTVLKTIVKQIFG